MLDDVQRTQRRLLAEGLLLRHQVGVVDMRILSVPDLSQLLLAEEFFLGRQRLCKYASRGRSHFDLSWLRHFVYGLRLHFNVLCRSGGSLLNTICGVASKLGIEVGLERLSGYADHGQPALVDAWVHQLYENSGGRFLSFLLVRTVATGDCLATEQQFRVETHQLVFFVLINPKIVKISYLHVLPGRNTLMVLAGDVREEHELVTICALDIF